MACSIPGTSQPDYSQVASEGGIPGNIGVARAKVLIWDHDPLLARPLQKVTFPFTQEAQFQLRESIPDLRFELNSAFLNPRYIPHDMFVATKKQVGTRNEPAANGSSSNVPVFGLDFVGSKKSGVGQIATERMPPSTGNSGSEYLSNGVTIIATPGLPGSSPIITSTTNWRIGRDIFPHQVWIYVGSLLKSGVPVHPSEYKISDAELISINNLANNLTTAVCAFSKWKLEEIKNAPKWDYVAIEDGAGNRAFTPVQITKPPEDGSSPVHWTLEKFTPIFQGEDFIVTVAKKDKDLTNVVDDEVDCVDTNWPEYKYLMYDPIRKPSGWVDGISNAAFYMETPKEENSPQENQTQSRDIRREVYWWRYKSYILIEVGVGDPVNNYFIELVKGRNPRFLHLGYEWDNPNRKVEGGVIDVDGFDFMKKCREISVFRNLSVDELFKKPSFNVVVRNHLGRLVITFEGYEGSPWIIQRLDNDPAKFDFTKILVPIVIPAGKVRIHGGNISAAINFSPVEYSRSATVKYNDLQFDTLGAENSDVYMTFSYIGNSILYDNPAFKNRYFREPRLGYGKVGYDCDAYYTQEVLKNNFRQLEVYENFSKQYRRYGKGWVNERNADTNGQALEDPLTGLSSPHSLRSGLNPSNGGVPHRLKITNLRSPNQTFTFGLNEASDASYPYKEYVSKWDVGVTFEAGSVLMPVVQGDDEIIIDSSARPKLFVNTVTPIATSWNAIVLGGGKPVQDNVEPVDVSELVNSINDSWSADDFTTINHEATVKLYIPLGIPKGGDPQQQFDPARKDLHALGQRVLKLVDKAFYVTVSYWWENGIGARDAPGNKITRDGPPNESDLLIQMTGISYGASIEKSVNKIFMELKVMDYMSVLQKQLIFNSPFFDGVADVEAIYELLKLAHFDDDRRRRAGIDRRPLGYLQKIVENINQIGDEKFTYNGEESRSRRFDLPGQYASLAEPSVRFQNGETFDSAIQKIAQQASKIAYFDRWGVFRYENIPAIEAAFASGNSESFTPIYEFRTTPFNVTASGAGDGSVSENRFEFNSSRHAAHLVYNVVSYTRSVEDVVNQIVLMTASSDIKLPDGTTTGGFIIEGYTFFEQIWNPNAEGFLGFRKPFYQSNGLFGGIEGVQNGILHYAKMKFPPAMISFETYGVPGIKALDIISLDDNLYYVTEITHELDPSTNNWWMNVSAEWLKPFMGDLGFLEERGSTDSETGQNTTVSQ